MAVIHTGMDRFTCGLWTVGWPVRDPFSDASRAPRDLLEAVGRLAELGATGVTLHNDPADHLLGSR